MLKEGSIKAKKWHKQLFIGVKKKSPLVFLCFYDAFKLCLTNYFHAQIQQSLPIDMVKLRLESYDSYFQMFESFTSESITGTSIKTPTTVTRAAPEFNPKSAIATATASSKKLLAPIIEAGEHTQ